MTMPLDFILLPIVRHQGIDQSDLPGLSAVLPPRRAGRGRAQDRLIMHLSLQGNAPLSAKAYAKLLDSLADTFFKATGSSTAAMRVVAESLNQSLFSRNQRGSSRGMRSVGIFTLAVFRNDRLYLAQCGPTHAYLARADGVQHFTDPSASGRGLGMGRATPIQYHQAQVSPGDVLILSPAPPSTWAPHTLQALYGKPIGQVHPRLLDQIDTDVEAVLVQIVSGSGKLRILRPELGSRGPTPAEQPASPEEPDALEESTITKDADHRPEILEDSLYPVDEPASLEPRSQNVSREQPAAVVSAPVQMVSSPKPEKTPKPPKPKRPPVIGPALLTIGRALGTTLAQFTRTLGAMFRRMLPDEKMLDLPPSLLLFIAVAVPVVIVSVASVIYFREGRGRMHQEKLMQAESVAEQALPLQDPAEVRAAWTQVLAYLDEAEMYGSTEDSQNLRRYAYSVIDNLEIVDRLDFQPGIVRGLPDSVTVTKIVVSVDNELYLLNGQNGNVLRATYTDQGYVLDPVFNCGPIPGPLMVGPLIDIATLPRAEEDGATLLGMDANGMLIRCVPGEDKGPNIEQMAPPDVNWGEPRAFSYDNGNIYVLDPQTNAVWIYWAINNYTEFPTYYFGNQVPQLQSVLDMTISDGDLYLLHEDGRITLCNYSSYVDAPTRCDDPAEFLDLRAGYQSGPVMEGTHFRQIQFAPPPDPSLYLFDPIDEAIYHLSLRLAFQRQYRPQNPLPGEPTAFAVGPNRRAFIATEDQVYFAIMP
jgi:hypothetical protein